jgi:uncharacterized membrane protein YqjE
MLGDTGADVEADQYELELREKDARLTIVLGLGLVVLAAGLFAAWSLIVQMIVDAQASARIQTGLLGAGATFAVLGVTGVGQGLRKAVAARAFKRTLLAAATRAGGGR